MALTKDGFRGALLGLAIGDAVGAAVEFQPRGTFEPVVEMTGGGPFRLDAGSWTDDTSMALCLAESLIACNGMNLRDQMERYLRWYREGLWSSKGYCFDIGIATRAAIERFEQTGDPYAGSQDERSAGNGSIMRLAPVPMFFAMDRARAVAESRESSRTTHQAAACLDACGELGGRLVDLLSGEKRDLSNYREVAESSIRGSGYVVDSLEAATWAFANGTSFEECILLAANLGDDADTTAAITGQMAGAYYGFDGIPKRWRAKCHRATEITGLADELYQLATTV